MAEARTPARTARGTSGGVVERLLSQAAMSRDSMICALAALAGFGVARWPGGVDQVFLGESLFWSAGIGLFSLCLFGLLGVRHQAWRYSGRNELTALLLGIAALSWAVAYVYVHTGAGPRWAVATATFALMSAALSMGGRWMSALRATGRATNPFGLGFPGRYPILMVGTAEAAAEALDRMAPARRRRIVGIIEPERSAHGGRTVKGVRVVGEVTDLARHLASVDSRLGAVTGIALAGDPDPARAIAKVMNLDELQARPLLTLDRNPSEASLRDVRPEDLLPRQERRLSDQPVRELVEGARVLVTGAAGSIGGELAQRLAGLGPAHLTVLDQSEFGLFEAQHRLEALLPRERFTVALASVRDPARLERVFEQARPDIVLHAAALKHVPMMEGHVCEAVMTNVFGAQNVIRAAAAAGAGHFVFISTDKAVQPVNVMGATKRAAEAVIASEAARANLSASIVRFGNVLGSSGSVVPRFEQQIEAGGPVTVTDPDATRYFMTLREAAALVLQAAALGAAPGEARLYHLDMGEPVQIDRLARLMIFLARLRLGRDIEIRYTGLRPGETLHESLSEPDEEARPTTVDGVVALMQGAAPAKGGERLDAALPALLDAARQGDAPRARALLEALVGGSGSRAENGAGPVANGPAADAECGNAGLESADAPLLADPRGASAASPPRS